MSVNTATAGGIGKTLSSADGSIVIGGGAGATLVDANVKVADKGITIGKLADAPQANQILVSVTNGVPAWADQATVTTANQKTSAVVDGTNTTVTSAPNATDAKITEYKVNVPTANGTSPGVVKQGNGTVVVGTGGELSINLNGTGTPGDPGAGKNLTSTDLTITGGLGATLTPVTADIKTDAVTTTKIADGAVTATKLSAGAGTAGRVAIADDNGNVSYSSILPDAVSGKDVKVAAGDRIKLGGTPVGAVLKEFTIDVDESNLKLQNIGGSLNAGQVSGGNAGDVFVVGADGKGSWVSKASATSVSNTSNVNVNKLSTTVNGTTGSEVDIIKTNELSLNTSNHLVSTVNGVVSTAPLNLGPAIAANDKTATVANGNNTTVTTDATNPNNPIYKVNVNNATAGETGAVKPGSGLAVAADGTLSVNTATAGGIGKTLSSADGSIVIGGGAGATLVDANVKVADKGITTTKMDDAAQANQILVSDVNKRPVWVDQSTVLANSTNALSNDGTNTLTSTVNGKVATAAAVNTVTNSLTGSELTTTVNGVSGKVDLAPAITNAQKTTTVVAGTNTTVTPTPATPNAAGNTAYTVNVPTADGTSPGVVKQAAPATATVNIDASGVLSINTANVAASLGKSLSNGDGSIIIGGTTAGAGATLVNATVSVATGGITNTKIANDAVTTDKILDGTIVNADIANSTILPGKLANTTLPNQVLVSNGSNVPTWVNQNTLAVNNLYTSNGSLLGDREVNVNGHLLTFKSTSLPVGSPELRETLFDYTNGAYLKNATTTGRSVIRASSGGSIVELLQDLNSPSQLLSSGTSTGLIIGSVSGSSTPLQLVTNGASRMYVAAGGNIGIGTALPSNALHVNATDPLRLQGLQPQAAVNTNQLIVADNTGVLKTLAAAGNNQVLTTSASGVPTWANQNALAVNNLYTSNGSLTADRTVDLNAHTLTFNNALSPAGKTTLTYSNANAARISHTTTTGTADIIVDAGGSTLNIFQNPNSASQITASGASTSLNIGTANTTPMTLTTSNLIRMHISDAGKVGIGTTNMLGTSNANVLLAVNGSIESANSTFADYVFEDYFKGYSELKKDYSFKSLKEVEKFINENKHLPGITSIKALRKNQRGEYIFNMSELSIQMLEKVEELYLHTIEQQKQLDAKDKEIQDLKAQQQKTDERLKRLEAALLKEKN